MTELSGTNDPNTPDPNTPDPSASSIPLEMRQTLIDAGQQHVVQFFEELNRKEREELLCQLKEIDFHQLSRLASADAARQESPCDIGSIAPPSAVQADGAGVPWTIADARQAGEESLRQGEVAAVIVAGGQGSRLGFHHPKGMYPIGPVSNRTLFQIFADQLLAVGRRFGVRIPLYLMTSEATHDETEHYFITNEYLGLKSEDVTIFKQGTMPAVEALTGKLLLASRSSLALSPDGHGGTVTALNRAGCLDDADQRGVKQLAYIQIDNPLAHLCEPVLLGHHVLSKSEMTTQVVRKRHALERVGNVVSIDGKVQIIEYSDLPEELATQQDDQGNLKYWAGNIAVHVLDLAFIKRSVDSVKSLPFHRAHKKVACLAADGSQLDPDEPNAVKFERFIFDLLPSANNAVVVEALASEAFAPVKNAVGAPTDTAELAKKAISDLHKSWLRESKIPFADSIKVEVNPCYALDLSEFAQKIDPAHRVTSDQYFEASSI
ncbi:UDPGP type 1 family protein [Rhodopirellula sp.]|nr:UDPGP type 1 family protein [Rhodopirellula sp.]MDB4678963.1 UDPGP type 1 family protein [Rhodopirellula sp.]